jgi:hypothetical protein
MMSPESRFTLFGIMLEPAALFFSGLPCPKTRQALKSAADLPAFSTGVS